MFSLEHVHLVCRDVVAMERFLVDVLGGRRVSHRVTNGMLNVEIEVGGGLIFMRDLRDGESRAEREIGQPAPIDHIGFRVADMSAAVARLHAHGIELIEGPHDWRDDLAFAYAVGPEGVVIELLDRRPRSERNAVPPINQAAVSPPHA